MYGIFLNICASSCSVQIGTDQQLTTVLTVCYYSIQLLLWEPIMVLSLLVKNRHGKKTNITEAIKWRRSPGKGDSSNTNYVVTSKSQTQMVSFFYSVIRLLKWNSLSLVLRSCIFPSKRWR